MDDARCARRWISSLRGICCRRCRAPVSGVKKVCIQQGLVTQHEFDWLHIRGRLGNVRSFVANKRLALTSIPHPRASSGSPNNTSSTPSARAGDDEVGIAFVRGGWVSALLLAHSLSGAGPHLRRRGGTGPKLLVPS